MTFDDKIEIRRENDLLALKKSKQVEPQIIRNPLARFFIVGSASGLGLGFSPFAPGTFGSLLGIPFGLWLLTLNLPLALVICGVFFIPAVWISNRAGLHFGNRDSGKIVIDEVLGQGIALLGCKHFIVQSQLSGWDTPWSLVIVSFLLFRLFDITKPFPARTMDRKADGFGVMADDVVAGLYAAILMRFIIHMWYSRYGSF